MADVNLVVDPEFKRLLPELSPAEYSQLEASLINDGCREPIVVWNNIIVDGHYRYEICKKNRIPFRLDQKRFSCREEVIRWICVNQMGRLDVNPELVRYQIGKRYNTEKLLTAHNPRGRNQYSEGVPGNMMRPPEDVRMGTAAAIARTYNCRCKSRW